MKKNKEIRLTINFVGEINGPAKITSFFYRGGQLFGECAFFYPNGSIELFKADCEVLSKMYDGCKLSWSTPSGHGKPVDRKISSAIKAIIIDLNNKSAK